MYRWYALHTKPRNEHTLSQLLTLKGITVYLPQVPKVGHGHRLTATEPLFPSYLFANIDLDTISFVSLRWTPGLRDVVNAADGPAPVDDEIIEHIQKRLVDKEILRSAAHERFRPNERVRLKGNTLEDLNVVFDHYLPGEARARVLIHILGRETPAEVAIDSLQKASALRNSSELRN
jgi:transcriptional antiterminator RfaH